MLFGIAGACRCNELTNLKFENVQDKGSYLFISLPNTKTNVPRSFTIMEEGFSINALEICRKYIHLRLENVSNVRFFLQYKNEKCTVQSVGINTMSKIPSKVAAFLNLPDAESYTGHSMRRSSATLLANAGGDLTTIKRHGGWKSSSVAEGYIEDSVSNKIDIAKKIQGAVSESVSEILAVKPTVDGTDVHPSTSTINLYNSDEAKKTIGAILIGITTLL